MSHETTKEFREIADGTIIFNHSSANSIFPVKLTAGVIKRCAVIPARYLHMVKNVFDLTGKERKKTLGLEDSGMYDYAIRIEFPTDMYSFECEGELFNYDIRLDWEWAVVRYDHAKQNHPYRDFILDDTRDTFLGVHIVGDIKEIIKESYSPTDEYLNYMGACQARGVQWASATPSELLKSQGKQ